MSKNYKKLQLFGIQKYVRDKAIIWVCKPKIRNEIIRQRISRTCIGELELRCVESEIEEVEWSLCRLR
jgi:hypothetical protein